MTSPHTVRYEAMNAMLLNEFLMEHRKVQALEASVAAQQKGFASQIAALTATLKAQATQVQKVSDQLRTQAPAPRVVANDCTFVTDRDARAYLAHLAALELEAKAAKHGAWR